MPEHFEEYSLQFTICDADSRFVECVGRLLSGSPVDVVEGRLEEVSAARGSGARDFDDILKNTDRMYLKGTITSA